LLATHVLREASAAAVFCHKARGPHSVRFLTMMQLVLRLATAQFTGHVLDRLLLLLAVMLELV
jgi:hypothetical protein